MLGHGQLYCRAFGPGDKVDDVTVNNTWSEITQKRSAEAFQSNLDSIEKDRKTLEAANKAPANAPADKEFDPLPAFGTDDNGNLIHDPEKTEE